MTICDICTGRHLTSICTTAERHIEACFTGTPDDYQPLPDNVVALPAFNDEERRAIRRYTRTRRDYNGIRVTRLA